MSKNKLIFIGKVTYEEVLQAYKDCRFRKRSTKNATKFEMSNIYEELYRLYLDINNGTYKISRSICFIVTRPKKREVFAADFRDRIVHHIIINRLNGIFESLFIDDNYSCRVNKGTLYGIKRLKNSIFEASAGYTEDCHVGKFDIQGFFMSISKELLWEKLKDLIETNFGEEGDILLSLTKQVVLHDPQKFCVRKSPDWMWEGLDPSKSLFTCKPGYGLPIGNITSQLFANFFMNDFDHWMKEHFKWYGRYVDDFYVIAKTKEEITIMVEEIRDYLYRTLGLRLHPDKIYIQHYTKGVKFIGSVVKRDKVYLGNETINNFYRKVHSFNKKDKTDPKVVIDFRNTLNSYLGFLTKGDSNWKRTKLLDKIDPEWWGHLMINEDHTKVSLRPGLQKRAKFIR